MSVTPLYTAEELTAEIALAKVDLTKARKLLSYKVDQGGSSCHVEREKVNVLENHLEWLQQKRANLEIGHGYQSVQGRVPHG